MTSPADGAEASFAGDLGSVCLLLLLQDGPACGRELAARLCELGLAGHVGRAERALAALSRAGLVEDDAASAASHEDRSYELTAQAFAELAASSDDLRRSQVVLQRFLARCGEHLAPAAPAGTAGP
jgi:DNA-binding PadR family transcriptional regulator